MAKFNFESPEERAAAVARALSLKPKIPGVYANRDGYVIDGFKGTTEIIVSFHDLDELLGETESVDDEVVVEPVSVTEPASEEVAEQVSADPVVVAPVVEETKEETKEERKARRAAKKAAE